MAYRNYLIISVILVLLAVGYWFYGGSVAMMNLQSWAGEHIEQGSDYYISDALIEEYNVTGTLGYQLVSDTISHFPNNDTTLLQQPLLTMFGDKGEVTTARSVHGKVLPGGNDIELWDNVVIIQSQPSDESPEALVQRVRMDTDFITLFPDEEIADTDRPVLITDTAGETRAVGMTAWYQSGKVHLKSRVRGVYEFGQRAD